MAGKTANGHSAKVPKVPVVKGLLSEEELIDIWNKSQKGTNVDFAKTKSFAGFSQASCLRIKNIDNFEKFATSLKSMKGEKLTNLELELNTSVDDKQLFHLIQAFPIQALRLTFKQKEHGDDECKEFCECALCNKVCGSSPYKVEEIVNDEKLGPGIQATIKAFKIHCLSGTCTYRFIKFMPSLQFLDVEAPNMQMGVSDNEQDLIGMELKRCLTMTQSEGHQSKIWKYIPSLKLLKLNDSIILTGPVRSGNPCVDLFEGILPQIFCDLRRADYQKMRHVCKTWKVAIDNLIQNHPLVRPFNLESYKTVELSRNYDLHMAKNLHAVGFNSPSAITNAFKRLKGVTENPFIGRSVAFLPTDLDLDGPVSAERFWTATHEFLEKYGQHIYYVTLNHSRTEHKSSELFLYKTIHRCFSLMPELRSLTIDANIKAIVAKGKDAQQVEGYISRNPLPKLKHFESIISFSSTTPTRVQDALFDAYGSQLQKLELMDLDAWNPKYGFLPRLSQLSVSKVCGKMLPTLLLSLDTPSLQRLELGFLSNMEENYLFEMLGRFQQVRVMSILLLPPPHAQSTPMIFGNLNHFMGPTGFQLLGPGSNEKRIVLPNVTHVYIRVCNSAQTFRFLESFPSLRYLTLRMSKRINEKNADEFGKELIKCSRGGKNARRSKIWDKLPNLRMLFLLPGTKIYRGGYVFQDLQWGPPANVYF